MTPSRYPWTWLVAVRHTPEPLRAADRAGQRGSGDRWLRRFNLFNVAFFGLLLLSLTLMLVGNVREPVTQPPAATAQHPSLR